MENNNRKYPYYLRLITCVRFFLVLVALTGMNNPDNYNRLLRNEQHNYYRQSDNYRERITEAVISACQAAMRARTWSASRVRETELAVAKIDFILNTELRIIISNITSNNLVQESLRRYNPGEHVEGIQRNNRDNRIRNIINVELERIERDVRSALRNTTEQRKLARWGLNGRPNAHGDMGKSFDQLLNEMRDSRDNLNQRIAPMPLLDNRDRDDIQLAASKLKYINKTSFQISAYADISLEELQRVEEYYDEAAELINEINQLIGNNG
ncbi:MAG: hypothetical protein NMK33_06415 (plasmid) [Candidatus Cardinium sp.]|uniref:hypothetical protein n=1 Tax=Cardinium endosymbiont of Dermatophagoides farinae TaxID=2597823 RepID=UPI001182AC94|nr:hypothetical protein [Cardinium endosymbiont of Dermatophagoides farinae]TSJ80180.1 hypothetical protein FPG78_06180 [Cardinium endosymbiont of Dermatophagoides farinae]UWW97553.1 MAG: hypothetical protein NMK33_06415 [Candidatus Cardinium sp.]